METFHLISMKMIRSFDRIQGGERRSFDRIPRWAVIGYDSELSVIACIGQTVVAFQVAIDLPTIGSLVSHCRW